MSLYALRNKNRIGGAEVAGGVYGDVDYLHIADNSAGFTQYIPVAADSYTLNNALGTPAGTGTTSRSIDSGYVKIQVNGGGRGALGNGFSGSPSSTYYQLLYAPTGGYAYTYGTYDDAFQPGTPHEIVGMYVDNTAYIGGGNETNSNVGTTYNGTTYIWQKLDGTIVVLMGTTTYGHMVVQYYINPLSPKIVRINVSYTNTTSASRSVVGIKGGDVDFGDYTTVNGRGSGSYSSTDLVYSSAQAGGKTLGIYCPGNGYTHNSVISVAFSDYNPNSALNNSAVAGNGDLAIYCAWNFGTVPVGGTVSATCYYVLGTSVSDMTATLGTI